MALRWRKHKITTGLAGIGEGPRGSSLNDGDIHYASVYASGGGWRGPIKGWFWVAGWGSGIPKKNTCDTLCDTQEEAKAQAMAYVKEHRKLLKKSK